MKPGGLLATAGGTTKPERCVDLFRVYSRKLVLFHKSVPLLKRSAADAFEFTANATPPSSETIQQTNPLTFTFQEMVDKETKQMLLQIGLDVSVVVGNFRTLLARLFVVGVLPLAKLKDQTEINADLISDESPFFLAIYLPTLTEPEENYHGPMDVVCEHCGAPQFGSESPTFCCSNGSVKLPPLSTPAFGDGIFSDKEFRKNIRRYNSTFAFTSTRMKYDKELPNSKKGVYSYIITGEVCHQIGPLLPEGAPKWLQRYFNSSEDQVKHRHQYDKELSQGRFIFVFSLLLFHFSFPDILASIGGYLEKNSGYVSIFHHARDMLEISQTPPQPAFELEFLPSNKTHLLHSLAISLSYNSVFAKQQPQMQYTENQSYGQTPYAQHQYHPPAPYQPLSIRPVKWHGQPQTMLGPSRRMIPSPFSQKSNVCKASSRLSSKRGLKHHNMFLS